MGQIIIKSDLSIIVEHCALSKAPQLRLIETLENVPINSKTLPLKNLIVNDDLLEGAIPTQASQQLLLYVKSIDNKFNEVQVLLSTHSGLGYYLLQALKVGLIKKIKVKKVFEISILEKLFERNKFPSTIDHLVGLIQEEKEKDLLSLNNLPGKLIDRVKISACITHFNRPQFINEALDSMLNQTYMPEEIIIIDDGSTNTDAIDRLKKIELKEYAVPVKVLWSQNKYLGAARNQGWKVAKSEFVFFMDDDDIAYPIELDFLSRAQALTDADITTCQMTYFDVKKTDMDMLSSQRWLPVGNSSELGFFVNLFGPANALYRKSLLAEMNGFTEDYGVGHEDWEFYAKSSKYGARIEVIPEPLFWCRRDKNNSMLYNTNLFTSFSRNLRPYIESLDKIERAIAQMTFGLMVEKEPHVGKMWQLRHNKFDYWNI